MNRFKGLDLVNSVPEELGTGVQNIVQEAADKTIPKTKKDKYHSYNQTDYILCSRDGEALYNQ